MGKKGYKHTEEAKRKISTWIKNNLPKTVFKKGHSYNKGIKRSKELRMRISEKQKGKHNSPATEFKKGNKISEEIKLKMGISRTGEKHWNWKGGITPKNVIIRNSKDYKKWRRDVFIRDHFTCQKCGHKFINIIAHHIKSFVEYKKFWFDLDNGQTLCKSCHNKIHNRKEVLK